MTSYIISVYIALSCLLATALSAQEEDIFYTISTVKSRPIAMGGAFTAIEDDIAAIDYNPAAFFLYRDQPVSRVTFFLNPVGATAAALSYNDIFKQGQGQTFDDILLATGLLMRSLCVTVGSLDLGLLLGEQGVTIPDTLQTGRFFRTDGLRQNHSHSLAASFKLARRVSIGATASYLVQSAENDPEAQVTGLSVNYGILLQPESGLRIGVFYTSMPDTLSGFRRNMDRIADESVNIGASYSPFRGTSLALDLRNLGEEGSFAIREFHGGIEQVLFSHVALRAGYFHGDEGRYTYSFGIGLFDGNTLFRAEKRFDHRNFLLNYAFVYETAPMFKTRTHFLTFVLRV